MSELSNVQLQLLKEVADLHEVPEGAYNLRSNGKSVSRNTTANINILTKTEGILITAVRRTASMTVFIVSISGKIQRYVM